MKARQFPLCLLIVFIISFPVIASSAPVTDSREITIYTRDLGEIMETRTVTLEKGDGQIVLPKIASGILPGSIVIDAGNVKTLAVSYSQDLLDETKYWNAQIGCEVEFFLSDDSVATKGILRQVDKKHLVLESIETPGELSNINLSEIEKKPFYLFKNSPVLEPSIVWNYSSKKKQTVTIIVSYLTENLTWNGEHRVNLNGKSATVEAGAVIENTSNQSLSYDKLTLIGGAIHLAGDRRRVDRLNPTPGSGNEDKVSSFGDLRRWTVEQPGTLTSNHTTVLPIIAEEGKAYSRNYIYDATIFDDRITSHLMLALVSAVPSGKVRVYEKLGKENYFVGEDKIDDTPSGSEMDLSMNQVFDLTAERLRMSETRTDNGGTSQVFNVILGNARGKDVNVLVLERVFGDWSIHNANVDGAAIGHNVKNARIAQFDVLVPAGKTVKLSYEIQYAR